jgi:hypothetical protein
LAAVCRILEMNHGCPIFVERKARRTQRLMQW